MNKPITRRKLKKDALLTGATSALPRIGLAPKTAATQSPGRVIIVGAGLAGLACGYELSKCNYDVQILEAQSRHGGRVLTLRKKFSNGLFAEAGAYSISNGHEVTKRYMKELRKFDVERTDKEVVPRHKHHSYYLEGRLFKTNFAPKEKWMDRMSLLPEEKELGLGGLLLSIIPGGVGQQSDPRTALSSLKSLDALTFIQYLQTLKLPFSSTRGEQPPTVSKSAIELLRPWFGWFDDLDRVSAYAIIMDAVISQDLSNPNQKWFTLKNGMDSLSNAFASKLAGKIQYNSPVVAIHQKETGVIATYMSPFGGEKEVAGDYLICAIPLPTLKKVKITPQLSISKRRASEEIEYAPVTRVYLQCKRRIWDPDNRANGSFFTDLPTEETSKIEICGMNLFDMTHTQKPKKGRGILGAYISGTPARRLSTMPETDRIRSVITSVKQVFPNIENVIESIDSKCWDQDPWSLGATPIFQPGQITALMTDVRKSEGRIHFAGDHTSDCPGWIEGALQSGKRAAFEIIEG